MRLERIYEDDEIIIEKAPSNNQLKKMILEVLGREGPMSINELHLRLSPLASRDRISKVVKELIEQDTLIELPDGAIAIPGTELDYVPRDIPRPRPLVPKKFRKRWGGLAAKIRSMKMPLGEALRIIEQSSRCRESSDRD